MLESFSWLLLIPLWLSVIFLCLEFIGLNLKKKIIVILSVFSTLVIFFYCLYGLYSSYINQYIEFSIPFIKINELNFCIGVYIDILSSLIGATISLITLIIQIFSVFYMQNEKNFLKFYSLINLFFVSMIAFIFSPNLFQTFLMWEVIGTISYFLIAYWNNKRIVSKDSRQVFLINIIGDICLFAAFITISCIIYQFTNDINNISIPYSNLNFITSIIVGINYREIYDLILVLLLIACFTKSAQFPINSWLINAMSAPTPVSALIHSSTLVIAGVYLIIRLFPLFIFEPFAIKIIMFVGLTTAILSSLSAMVQTNVKKALAYSTSAQIGIIFLALGCYNPIVAIVYIISHAFIKSLLFMCVGIVIKIMNTKNLLFIGKLRDYLPVSALCFFVGVLSITGLGFCGFNSKSMLTEIYCTNNLSYILFGLIGILTALYSFRLYFLIFEKSTNTEYANKFNKLNRLKYNLANSCIIVMSLIVIIFSFLTPAGHICPLYLINLLILPLSWFLYCKNNSIIKVNFIYRAIKKGFYLDRIYYFIEHVLYKNFVKIIVFIDNQLIGEFGKLFNKAISFAANNEYSLQTNNYQSYISYGIWVLILIFVIFTLLYLLILNIFGV